MLPHLVDAIAAALALPASRVRPSVQAFAERMEATLSKHDAEKGGQSNWRKDSVASLIERLEDEAWEVKNALETGGSNTDIANEAVDVANFALMISDVCDPLPNDTLAVKQAGGAA